MRWKGRTQWICVERRDGGVEEWAKQTTPIVCSQLWMGALFRIYVNWQTGIKLKQATKKKTIFSFNIS